MEFCEPIPRPPTVAGKLRCLAAALAPDGLIDPDASSSRHWFAFVLTMGAGVGLSVISLAIVIGFAVAGSAPAGGGLVLLVALVTAAVASLYAGLLFVKLAAAAQRESPERVRRAATSERIGRVRDDRGRLTLLGWTMVISLLGSAGIILWNLLDR